MDGFSHYWLGKEKNQGLAYLDDGTMIVIEEGLRHVGQIITVEITGLFYEFKTRLLTKVENLDDSIIDYEWEV